VLEGVTTAAVKTILDTEVLIRTAGSSGTKGLTALEGQVSLTILERTVEEADASASKEILITALVDALRSVDDSRNS
jgi:hypothetical protein